MNLRKTITISVMFHLCLFSAALLFSSGLLKGSGNSPEQEVFFINLEADGELKKPGKKKTAQGASLPRQKKKIEEETAPTVHEKKKIEVLTARAALQSTDEPVTQEAGEKEQRDSEEQKAEEHDEASSAHLKSSTDTGFDEIHDEQSMVQTALLDPAFQIRGPGHGAARSGLSPAMIDVIGSAINRVKTYPMLARRRGMEGTVHVSFRINENGRPDEIKIKKSSGYRILDSATVQVVKKAAPYPVIASRIEVPVAYKLQD